MTAIRDHGLAWAALVFGFISLAASPAGVDGLDAGGVGFMAGVSAGAVIGLRRWESLRWIAASLPFWAMSGAVGWAQYVALGLTFLGMALGAVGPTLPGRRRRRAGAPMPHLASGPLVPVVARVYQNAHPSRVIQVATIVFGVLAVVLAIPAARGGDPETTALAVSSLIIAVTFAFSNWFAGRVQLRVDGEGLHSRVFFRVHTIPWPEVSALHLRYVFLPGVGGRIVYYCVRSPTREFAFPSSMRGAGELQATIESATGQSWPVPGITPTL